MFRLSPFRAVSRRVECLSFDQAREQVRRRNIRNSIDYRRWAGTDSKPPNIPAYPATKYANEWVSWYDWLGTRQKKCDPSVSRERKNARLLTLVQQLTAQNKDIEFRKVSNRSKIDVIYRFGKCSNISVDPDERVWVPLRFHSIATERCEKFWHAARSPPVVRILQTGSSETCF